MTALPLASQSAGGIACLYAVIHLDRAARTAAYSEFYRVLRPGGHALIAFHVRSDEVEAGGSIVRTEWWGHEINLTFRFLDPVAEGAALLVVGLELVARVDRRPHLGAEYPSSRSYLLVQRPD